MSITEVANQRDIIRNNRLRETETVRKEVRVKKNRTNHRVRGFNVIEERK